MESNLYKFHRGEYIYFYFCEARFVESEWTAAEARFVESEWTAAEARFVESEWTAAEAAKLPIIPVFLNPACIPLLLRSRTGVLIQTNYLNTTIAEIHDLLVKKTSEKQTPGAMPSQHLPVASTGGHIPGVISAPVPEAKEPIIPSKCPKCGAALKKAGEKGPATCPFCKGKVA